MSTAVGDVLFAEGQSEYDMHVVLSGSVGVYDDVDGERTLLIGGVGARQLLGEMDVLMGESTCATAVVDEPGEVVEVPRAAVLEIVSSDPELSEVILRAFAARRAFNADAGSGLTIVGRRGDPAALRLAEFAQRSYLPATWWDPADENAAAVLARSGRTAEQARERPVVAWGTNVVLDAPSNRELAAVVGGGGNSAGRAAIFLPSHATRVLVCLWGGDLRKGMSDYLARRIEAHPAIELRTGTEVTALRGDGVLEEVALTGGGEERLACRAVFSFIGATPCTGWLEGVALDGRGFVLTGPEVAAADAARADGADRSALDEPDLQPARLAFETSVPGVFAVGDIRSGSTKRVAGAVGEGSVCVSGVHRYLTG